MSHFGALAAAASGRSPFMLYPGVGIAGNTANALDKHWYSAWSQPLSAAISPTGKRVTLVGFFSKSDLTDSATNTIGYCPNVPSSIPVEIASSSTRVFRAVSPRVARYTTDVWWWR